MLFSKIRRAAGILALSLYSSFLFSQIDTVPPVLTCLDTLETRLGSSGFQTVFANEVLLSVSDDQSTLSEIDLGLCADICLFVFSEDSCSSDFPTNPNGTPDSMVTFNCAHTFNWGAENYLKLWARDAAGNVSTCRTRYFVYDIMSGCGPINPPPKGGLIIATTPARREPVKGVQVSLQATPFSTVASPFFGQDTTNSNGFFLIPKGHNDRFNVTFADIEIKPYKNDDWTNGVNAYDLLLLQKHLLGTEPILEPYRLIGADANASGSITPVDIIELRKLILGIYPDSLPNNTSWRFVASDYSFSNPLNPFLDTFPEILKMAGNDFCQKMNFEAIKIGDLDFSATYHATQQADDRDADVFMNVESFPFTKGAIFDVPFTLENTAVAYQFTLDCDGLEPLGVFDENDNKHPHYTFFKDKNALSLLMESESNNFTIRFKALKNGTTHSTFRLTDAITKSLIFDKKGISKPLALRIKMKDFDILKNVNIRPNPFTSQLHIQLSAPKSELLSFRLMDAYGRVLFSEKRHLNRGDNHIFLETESLGKGAYFLEVLGEQAILLLQVVK